MKLSNLGRKHGKGKSAVLTKEITANCHIGLLLTADYFKKFKIYYFLTLFNGMSFKTIDLSYTNKFVTSW